MLDRLRDERTLSVEFVGPSIADLELTSATPSCGLLTAGDFAHEWPYHDQDHIQQILDATKPRYLESMTANMPAARWGLDGLIEHPIPDQPVLLCDFCQS